MMKPQQIKRYVTFCKKNGIKRLKMDNFEIEFNDNKPISKVPDESFIPTKGAVPTEDDMLYWSSDFDPKEEREESQATQ